VSSEVHSSRVDFNINDVGVTDCHSHGAVSSATTTDIYLLSSDSSTVTQSYVSRLQSDYTNVWSK